MAATGGGWDTGLPIHTNPVTTCPACPPPDWSFEGRIVALAKVLYLDRPMAVIDYTWSEALSDATDIITWSKETE